MNFIHTGQWDRLSAVITWSGLSTHSFAYNLGLKRSENLYRIKSHKNGISRRLVERIVEAYPEISDIWLMTGSGTMLKSIDYVNVIDVPYYALGISQYLETPERCNSRYVIPVTYNAELAIDVTDSIINAIVPSGTVALLKQVPKDKIIFGNPYYVVTEFFNEFCILEDSKEKNEIILKGTIIEKDEPQKNLNELEEIKQLKLRIKELKEKIANKDTEPKEADDELNEFNSTSIDLSVVNYIYAIRGFVTKL